MKRSHQHIVAADNRAGVVMTRLPSSITPKDHKCVNGIRTPPDVLVAICDGADRVQRELHDEPTPEAIAEMTARLRQVKGLPPSEYRS